MKLHQLHKSKGLHDKQRRLGRGNATGSGNYSGRGLKGQKARSGHGLRAFFEGGQTSIVQRLPKARGFTRHPKLVDSFETINLGKLNLDVRVTDTMEISKEVLKQLGYIKHAKCLVKILGDGEYTKHLKFIDIDAFSASAKAKIEKPGTPSKTAGKPYAKIEKKVKKLKSSKVKKVKAKKIEVKKVEPKKVEVKKVEIKKVEAPKVVTKKVVEKPVEKITKVYVKKVEKVVEKPVVKKVVPAKKAVAKKAPTTASKPVKKVAPIKKTAPTKVGKPAKKTKYSKLK